MSKNISVGVTDPITDFIAPRFPKKYDGIATDLYQAGSEFLEKREAKLTALRAALVEGEASGPPVELDFEAFLADRRREGEAAE